ncbi:hypothetical protein [Solimonas marina]|uniref:PBP domain-containing protein n=1 Tax=Solimonas marina TaxID=2714601 RepID=A0A970B4Y7_9GAMM|nr:hypothetical protein [Solimonas marina]NKF22822.1 hypothetical protein [Solimonas marina]
MLLRLASRLLPALLATLVCIAARAADPIAVIVAPSEAGARIDADDLALIFRRKRQYWPDGTRIEPANLAADDPLRLAFSRAVLGAAPAALENYWNEQYFRGIRPPYVLASPAAMLRFVAATPGAIGYVRSCAASADVAVIGYLDDGGHWHRGHVAAPAC